MNKNVFSGIKYICMNQISDIHAYHQVSHARWDDAIACYRNKNYFGAIYLAGYSAECMLKYAILQTLYAGKNDINLKELASQDKKFVPLKDHKLGKLIDLGNDNFTELFNKSIFDVPKRYDFLDVIEWTSEWRYSTDSVLEMHAESFLNSVRELIKQLKDNTDRKLNIKELKEVV